MEGIAFTAAVAILELLSAVGFAYRGMWPMAGMQFAYAVGNVFLIWGAMQLRP